MSNFRTFDRRFSIITDNCMPATSLIDIQLIDRDELLSRCLGNLDLAESILQKFLAQIRCQLDSIEAAADDGAIEQVQCTAHRVKGMAANVAARSVKESAAQLEDICRGRDYAGLPFAIDDLRTQVQQLEGAIEPEWPRIAGHCLETA